MLALYAPILGTRATRAYAFLGETGPSQRGSSGARTLTMKSNPARKSSVAFKRSIFLYN